MCSPRTVTLQTMSLQLVISSFLSLRQTLMPELTLLTSIQFQACAIALLSQIRQTSLIRRIWERRMVARASDFEHKRAHRQCCISLLAMRTHALAHNRTSTNLLKLLPSGHIRVLFPSRQNTVMLPAWRSSRPSSTQWTPTVTAGTAWD